VPDFDWKNDSGIAGVVIVVLGVFRRILAPYAAKQFLELVRPSLEEFGAQMTALTSEAHNARRELLELRVTDMTELRERLAALEATVATLLERRRGPR
jgi:hypothetical protein